MQYFVLRSDKTDYTLFVGHTLEGKLSKLDKL